jgi:hypothetical protein
MNRLSAVLFALILLACRPPNALSAPTADSTAIREIHGPLPPAGPPPFAVTALVLLVAGLGLAMAARARKGRNRTVAPPPMPSPAMDDLTALREAYARGELPAMLLFEQLAAIARSQLIRSDCSAMTSQELLKAAIDTVPAETVAVATALLAVCDRVRFGACLPDTVTVAEAFASVEQLLECQTGAAP